MAIEFDLCYAFERNSAPRSCGNFKYGCLSQSSHPIANYDRIEIVASE